MLTNNEMESLRREIIWESLASKYDHRPFIHPEIAVAFPQVLEDCQLQYARFKYAVTKALRPKTVYEVGVGWGISALAFHNGCPSSHYFGIDNGEKQPNAISTHSINMRTAIVDSATVPAFVHPDGPIDLLYIDGGHGLEHKAADIVKALEARPEWLLVDDVNNVMVAAGTFAGLYKAHRNADLQMCYVGNSHTGNLLVHVNRQEPDYRGLEVRRT